MIYSVDILREFVVTAYLAAEELNHPGGAAEMREVLSSRSRVHEMARHTATLTFERWSPEQRVRAARALSAKGLPSLLDMMISFEGKEQKMLRAKRIVDEAEYTIVNDLLAGDVLTDRQRIKLETMLKAYDDDILRNPNSERAKSRTRR